MSVAVSVVAVMVTMTMALAPMMPMAVVTVPPFVLHRNFAVPRSGGRAVKKPIGKHSENS